MRYSTRLVLWLLVGLGALSAVKIAGTRWRAESLNRRVAIIVDWDEVRGMAVETSTPPVNVLKRFQTAGATGVAVAEETVADLVASQRIEVLTPRRSATNLSVSAIRIRIREDDLRDRVLDALKHKWNLEMDSRDTTFSIPAAWSDLGALTVGWPESTTTAIRAAGMTPVLRAVNFATADSASCRWEVERMKALGCRLVVFGGEQVLGYADSVDETAEALQENGILYGQVEFGKQKGEDVLANKLKGRLVRVHSINPTEMARLSLPSAIDRFLLAAEERNIRALYVRAIPGAPNPLIEANTTYVRQLRDALTKRGLEMGMPHEYLDYDSNALERSLIGLGVAAATMLAVLYAWPATGATLFFLLLLVVFDVAAPGLPFTTLGRKLVALQGAFLMPVLALLGLRSRLERRQTEPDSVFDERLSLVRGVWRAIPLYLLASCISLLGGLWVVGLLSSRLGSMHLLEFQGVKVQQAGAILAVAAVFFLGISSRGGIRAARARVKRHLEDLWSQPLMLGGLVVAFIALMALALLMARSGNDPGVGVSSMEMRFRSILDTVMGIRPRTKEFLVGHPALLLGIALISVRKIRWGLPLLVVGSIGQASITNTFCHLHTPLAVSLLRWFNGLVAGVFVAFMYAFVADRFRRGPAAD